MEAGQEWNWPEIRGQRMNRPASSSSPAAGMPQGRLLRPPYPVPLQTGGPGGAGSGHGDRFPSAPRPDRVTLRLGSKTSVLSLDTLLYAKSQSHGTVAAFPNGQLRKHSSAAATAAHSRKKEAFMIIFVFSGAVSYPLLFGMIVPRCWAVS